MHHLVTSLLPCRVQLPRAATAAATRISNFEARYLTTKDEAQKPDANEPKPDTPDEVAPEIEEGAAPMDLDPAAFNAREGGEGGPGKIPIKNEQIKEESHHGRQGEGEAKGSGGGEAAQAGKSKDQKSVGSKQQSNKQDGSMGPDSVGDTHRLDYSR